MEQKKKVMQVASISL